MFTEQSQFRAIHFDESTLKMNGSEPRPSRKCVHALTPGGLPGDACGTVAVRGHVHRQQPSLCLGMGGVGLVPQAAIRDHITATVLETKAIKSARSSDSSDSGECREECMGMSLPTYLPMGTSARCIWCMLVA